MIELLVEFYKAVSEMRDAQRAYFKDRKRDDLIRSKDLELKVDNLIYALSKPEIFIKKPEVSND